MAIIDKFPAPDARINVAGGAATGATLQAQVAEIFADDPNYLKAGITKEKIQDALGKPNLAEPRKLICPLFMAAWIASPETSLPLSALALEWVQCKREACAVWQGYRCGLARV